VSELKACPFCGKAPLVRSLGAEMIICPNGCVFMATDDRLERWNTRPLEDALKAENAKLREALTDLLSLIDEHGEATIRAHATQLLKIRNIARAEEALK